MIQDHRRRKAHPWAIHDGPNPCRDCGRAQAEPEKTRQTPVRHQERGDKNRQQDGRHMTITPPHAFSDAAPALAGLKPRVRVEVVTELTGLKRRTITDLASKDRIPGAVKHGKTWTFDQDLLALWITRGSKWQTTSTAFLSISSINSSIKRLKCTMPSGPRSSISSGKG